MTTCAGSKDWESPHGSAPPGRLEPTRITEMSKSRLLQRTTPVGLRPSANWSITSDEPLVTWVLVTAKSSATRKAVPVASDVSTRITDATARLIASGPHAGTGVSIRGRVVGERRIRGV